MEPGLFKMLLPSHGLPLIAVVLVSAILTDSFALAQVNVEPNTALLNEGDRTELLCRYGRSINYCRIEIPGEKVLNLSPDWSKTPGFTYYGAGLAAGQCGVSIERVKATNNGQVKCSLGVEGEELSGTIDLVVALRPQQPLIELMTKADRDGYFPENAQFRARCIVRDGRPAANISWYIDDYPADKRVSNMEVLASPTDRNMTLSTTVQEIQWHLSSEDSGRKLICRSHHQTDRENVPPQEGAYLLLVRYAPVRQAESLVYGLYLGHTAIVNMTIRANPAPVVEWTIDGVVVTQGSQHERFSVYEPQYLGQDYYNVTMAIAGLTLEDTTKSYQLRASNALGSTDYTVRISSSSTPPSSGLETGAIVGIVVAIAVVLLIVLLIIFARVTGRWCFGGKSLKTQTSETSDTESADIKATSTATTATTTAITTTTATATADAETSNQPGHNEDAEAQQSSASAAAAAAALHEDAPKKSLRLPNFASFFTRKNEKKSKRYVVNDNEAGATSNAAAEAEQQLEGTDGNDNEPKEDKQLVYAELVLKPAEHPEQPLPPKNATEYAEIVYVKKQNTDAAAATKK